jgi:hypothetical protein
MDKRSYEEKIQWFRNFAQAHKSDRRPQMRYYVEYLEDWIERHDPSQKLLPLTYNEFMFK